MKRQIRIAKALEILSYPSSPWVKSAEKRANMTISCKDGDIIPRVKNAGMSTTVEGKDVQIMHNGLKVLKGGYQGQWQAEIIKKLRGIHEPQEEKVFYEVLKRIRPGGTMIELGSWWSYYSMWFIKEIENSKAYCFEPDPENIQLGKNNAILNNFKIGEQINFYQYAAGSKDNKTIQFMTENRQSVDATIRTIDSIVEEENIDKIDLLHLDIQGVELEALKGAENSIKSGKIHYLFVSTHHYAISGDPAMHEKCINFIKQNNGTIIAKHTILESCSGDGLIVASFDKIDYEFKVPVTLQPVDESLFRNPDLDLEILWHAHDDLYKEVIRLKKESIDLVNVIGEKQFELNNANEKLNELTPFRKHLKRQVKSSVSKHIPRHKST